MCMSIFVMPLGKGCTESEFPQVFGSPIQMFIYGGCKYKQWDYMRAWQKAFLSLNCRTVLVYSPLHMEIIPKIPGIVSRERWLYRSSVCTLPPIPTDVVHVYREKQGLPCCMHSHHPAVLLSSHPKNMTVM